MTAPTGKAAREVELERLARAIETCEAKIDATWRELDPRIERYKGLRREWDRLRERYMAVLFADEEEGDDHDVLQIQADL